MKKNKISETALRKYYFAMEKNKMAGMTLRIWLYGKGYKYKDFSKILGISINYLSLIINGKRIPGKFLSDVIFNKTNGKVKFRD